MSRRGAGRGRSWSVVGIVVGALVGVAAIAVTERVAWGHEFRPALLSLSERAPGVFTVEWIRDRGPGGASLTPVLPALCVPSAPKVTRRDGPVDIDAWSIACRPASLVGASIGVSGLATPATAVVRVRQLDGSQYTQALHPHQWMVEIPAMTERSESDPGVARAYIRLGVAHIAAGIDHLAFVLVLLLLVGARLRPVIATITAFTVGHSVTLGLAVAGVVAPPVAPIEALIALSIAWVAVDVARARRGAEPAAHSSGSRPWLMAMAFGLLHGFGFAGALTAVGVPAGDMAVALVSFNIGVELGQLAFVAALLAVRAALVSVAARAGASRLLAGAPRVMAYAIGGVACYWTLDRIVGIGGLG